jgi:uncharacterized protein (DUF488 family)
MLFTIGHSNRSTAEFFEPLLARDVQLIADVRSRPYSRFHRFNKDAIAAEANSRGIEYAWLGEHLGGLLRHDLDDPAVAAALDALATNCRRVAIFCAEGAPEQCHRTTFIAAALLVRSGVVSRSILRDDREEPVSRTLLRANIELVPESIREETVRLCLRAESA